MTRAVAVALIIGTLVGLVGVAVSFLAVHQAR
jgi:hypothetical protein